MVSRITREPAKPIKAPGSAMSKSPNIEKEARPLHGMLSIRSFFIQTQEIVYQSITPLSDDQKATSRQFCKCRC